MLVLSGEIHLHRHAEKVSLTPGVAVVISAAAKVTWQHDARAKMLCLTINRASLERPLTALVGRPLPEPIEFEFLVRTPPLVRLVRFLTTEVGQNHVLVEQSAMSKTYAELLMRTLLTQQPSNYSSWLATDVPDSAPRQLLRAEKSSKAYADQPISMKKVARAVGYSVRSMNRAFRRYRDCTPLEFLWDKRLDRARRMLSTPGGVRSVTDAAMNSGFSGPGRFSIRYRDRFGESPSATFKRTEQARDTTPV